MPAFVQLQRQLTNHIRNPEQCSGPEYIEPRRLKIYRELFFNNIEGFVSAGFPVLRSLYDDADWNALVREFMVKHQCHTPYFLEITQEFLLFLQQSDKPGPNDPPFMLELAHYEWAEIALDIAEDDLVDVQVNHQGDLLEQLPVVSPLAWSLAYQYPVHQIGVGFQPQKVQPQQADQITYLVVYRNREDTVKFMEANAVTARLLELLQEDAAESGRQVLIQLAAEMSHPQPEQLLVSGLEILQQLHSLDIILGTNAS